MPAADAAVGRLVIGTVCALGQGITPSVGIEDGRLVDGTVCPLGHAMTPLADLDWPGVVPLGQDMTLDGKLGVETDLVC